MELSENDRTVLRGLHDRTGKPTIISPSLDAVSAVDPNCDFYSKY